MSSVHRHFDNTDPLAGVDSITGDIAVSGLLGGPWASSAHPRMLCRLRHGDWVCLSTSVRVTLDSECSLFLPSGTPGIVQATPITSDKVLVGFGHYSLVWLDRDSVDEIFVQ